MFSSSSCTTNTNAKASKTYTPSNTTHSSTANVNGTNVSAASDSTRRTSRESIIQQMFRQQSENKSTKETVYSSIFSGNQTSLDSKRRSSAGIGVDTTGNQANTAPKLGLT